MDNNKIEKLKYEIDGEENSFVLTLRCKLFWDHKRLMNLLNLMYENIVDFLKNDIFERDYVYGFWFVYTFTKSWTQHENFRPRNKYSDEYYTSVYEILYFLCNWYFSGECPFTEKETFLEEFKLIDDYSKKEKNSL